MTSYVTFMLPSGTDIQLCVGLPSLQRRGFLPQPEERVSLTAALNFPYCMALCALR